MKRQPLICPVTKNSPSENLVMSAQATKTEETETQTPPQSDQDVKKIEDESLSSPPAEPGKKKRKLNDGSSIQEDGQSTSFFSSFTNFLSGSWFWSSSKPDKINAALKAEVSTSDGKPSKSTRADKETTEEEGSAETPAETAKPSDDKKEESAELPKNVETEEEKILESKASIEKTADEDRTPKDSATVTNSSVDSDDKDDDDVQSGDDDTDDKLEDENEESPSDIKNVVLDGPESPKAVTVEIRGSRKRRRLS